MDCVVGGVEGIGYGMGINMTCVNESLSSVV